DRPLADRNFSRCSRAERQLVYKDVFGRLANTTGWSRRRGMLPGVFMWEVMFWPIAASVLLPWLLVYLGLHVVQRGIIFVDIAMAQMASLGICLAVLLQFEPESMTAYGIGLGVTILGAAVFAVTGKRATRVPQQAIIGITYVIAPAAAILLLSRSAHGNEEIRNMLVGDITVVSATEVWKCFAVFLVVGVFHFLLRKKFLLVSFQRNE